MNILVACEEIQRVCAEFRKRGHRAFSCDIIEPSGGHPEWHIQGDVLPLLNGRCSFTTMDGTQHIQDSRWDMIIAFPPCTYLCVTGNRWFNIERYGDKARQRYKNRYDAIVFFMRFALANCEKIAIENPVGVMSSCFRKADQIINPYLFGDHYEKKTCLWLKNLPLLSPTQIVKPPQRRKYASGKTMATWYADSWCQSKERSKTFPGIAKAMAEQWG